jgi:prepilin-type N-terminal cleavage/methylation domain-containing protein
MQKVNKGFTLIEVMVTALITSTAVAALLMVYINALNLIIQAKEMAIACDDVKDVLEKMKSTAFTDIPKVGNFPDNGLVAASVVGGFSLNNEQIRVALKRADGTEANVIISNIPDPMLIEVTVSWRGKDGRNYARVFQTIRTGGI